MIATACAGRGPKGGFPVKRPILCLLVLAASVAALPASGVTFEKTTVRSGDVEAALDLLLKHPHACRMPAGIVGQSRGP